MNKKSELLFKGALLKWMREFFEMKGIPEIRYNQFSFAGSCENAPTTFWIDKKDKFYMLPQTRQIMAEVDLIKNDMDAVYMIQTSYRDEPKAGDGRHKSMFGLCEMEHKDMSQEELIDFEEEILKFCISKSLEYFKEHKDIVSKQNIARLKYTLEVDMPRVSYTDMIKRLQEKGVSINWGDDLSSRDEEFICGMDYDIPVPVTVYDYPETLKYFNMYLRRDTEGTDREVVECADMLLPFAGETFGSSRRENEEKRMRKRFYEGSMYRQLKDRLSNRADVITKTIKITKETGGEMPDIAETIIDNAFRPYFDLFSKEQHDRAGFGLGVGRLCQFLLGRTEIVEM